MKLFTINLMRHLKFIAFSLLTLGFFSGFRPPSMKLALLKYNGGGDWYANPTSLKNLSRFCNEKLQMSLDPDYATVEVGSPDIFNFPFVHMTGHGNVVFSDSDAENLRTYLLSGGFLHIDDNYGMDPYIRPNMKKVFPELTLTEIPANHPVYNSVYPMKGMPKIHEHDGKAAQGFGLFWKNRLVAIYDHETDLGDGWDDVHGDPIEIRILALKMGANIVKYAFTR